MLIALTNYFVLQAVCSVALIGGIVLMVRYGYTPGRAWLAKQQQYYDRVLCRQLLLDIDPRLAVWAHVGAIGFVLIAGVYLTGVLIGLVLTGVTAFVPYFVIRHLEAKRRLRLEVQLVDGLASMASGVRAGLNLVQSIELLVQNQDGPIEQEFGQILREYEMGMDLNQAMRQASDRIGSPLYRLTFTAIEMHRLRGGDSGESMDRIAESIREIQRLEGKLDAITSQGRIQANMMAIMAVVIIVMMMMMFPDDTMMLFTETAGRILLVFSAGLIVAGYLWIRKIMQVDI
ncbi:MAG: type II secretion system F family protein [Phycisphaeraceae bacterium]